ncbi:hypothetical protein LXL04_000487 [Taraxacum kok-saghyz]
MHNVRSTKNSTKYDYYSFVMLSHSPEHISTFTEHPDHHRSRPKSSLFNQNQTDYTCNMSHGIMLEPFTNIKTFTGSTTSPRPHPKSPDLNSNAIKSHRVLFHIFSFSDHPCSRGISTDKENKATRF